MRCTIDWAGFFGPPLVSKAQCIAILCLNNMLSSGQVFAILLITTTACGLKLPAQTPRRTTPTSVPIPDRTAPPTPPTTSELQMPRDGQMDEPETPTARPRSEGSVSREVATAKKPQHAANNPVGENTALYILQGSNNAPCILFKVDAVLTVKFITKLNEEDERPVFIPNSIQIDGDCGSGDDAQMILQWSEFTLRLYFTKTPGGDGWFVERMDLDVQTDNPHLFEHIINPGSEHLVTNDKKGFFYTPVGKSYSCKDETTVLLTSPSGKGKVRAELLLRDLRLQPFIFRKEGFGPEHVCSAKGVSFRDETAPIAVGSTLAIVVLCTVTGYAVFRYFKIKKVQYDTME